MKLASRLMIVLVLVASLCSCKDKIVIYPNEYGDSAKTILDSLPASFVHPGILHTADRIKQLQAIVNTADANSYAYQDYLLMKSNSLAQSNYSMKGPFPIISRDGVNASTKSQYEADFSAAYLNALMWAVTNQENYAKEAMNILVAYANTLKQIEVSNDAPLLAGLQGFQVIYATELLSYTYPGVNKDDIEKIKAMIKNVFVPVMDTFYNTPAYTNGNWGIIVTKAYMAAAILFDDHDMYKKGVDFFFHGNDNGTLPNYIDGTTGQCQESGRDQGHAQLGIGGIATICELAYQQGTDLYAALDNRLLLGYEYTAKYNLGFDVPFKTWTDVTGKYSSWTTISSDSRGAFRAIYAMAYDHYVVLKGLDMPYTKQVVTGKLTTEGYDADNIGFGTFQFAGN